MRRFAFLIATGITFIALFFAGFAVFAPASVDAPAPPAEVAVPTERGQAAGRLAGMSFAAVASSVLPAPAVISLDPVAFDGLFDASLSRLELLSGSLGTSTTSTSSTTTTAPASTTTTEPPTTTSTRPATTTTQPPTTTTTLPPTTTTSSTTTSSTTTTTTQPPTTVPSSGPLTESEMRDLAARFFPAEEVDNAVEVARCESGFNPNAYNPYGYGGLFQHHEDYWADRAEQSGYAGASIFDAEANTAAAAWLWGVRGWAPWGCAP